MALLVRNFTKKKFDKKYLESVAEKTLEVGGFKKQAEISLVIVGEKKIRSLNKKYRNLNKATDVLSFGEENPEKGVRFINPPEKTAYLGEIFICASRVCSQAAQKGHSEKKEMTILLIHGILHLLGHDHKEDYSSSEMKKKEEEIFERLINVRK